MITPTYFFAPGIFSGRAVYEDDRLADIDCGLGDIVQGIPEGKHGVDIDILKKKIQAIPGHKAPINIDSESKIYRFVFYLIPTFSNPSSTVIDSECREALITVRKLNVTNYAYAKVG